MYQLDSERTTEHSSGIDSPSLEPGTGVTKTGTTTVAMAGTDGVVLAADSRASLGGRFVTNRSARKVERIDDRTALTFAGSVTDAQAFCRQLRAENRLYRLRHGRPPSVATTAQFAGTLVRTVPYRHLSLLLGGLDDKPAVYDVDRGGGVLTGPYVASGSGMQLAYGALERAYDPDRSVDDLRTTAVAAVESATERDTASGDGLTLATITADGVSIDFFDDVPTAVDRYAPDAEGDDGRTDEEAV